MTARAQTRCVNFSEDKRSDLYENFESKGPFPLRAWKKAFFVSFIDLRLKRAVKIEASAKKNQ